MSRPMTIDVNETRKLIPVPDVYSFQNVWENKSDALIQELVDFWLSNHALTDKEAAAKRAPQVVLTVRGADGALAAVSTIYQDLHPRMGVRFHNFRCFVGA